MKIYSWVIGGIIVLCVVAFIINDIRNEMKLFNEFKKMSKKEQREIYEWRFGGGRARG